MTEKTGNKSPETNQRKEILFKCKFCGETRPLSELIMIRQYYPQIPSCKACAKNTKTASDST
jgi:hypothetical protein